tara:strand:- start:151 stop:354 length:204 start_codon:yes stop_codon:yes gene_type:complete
MHTSGQNFKNIRSSGNNHLFGAWIKGKLEKNNALKKLRPFNEDVINNYGRKDLKFYLIDKNKYYISF